MNVALTLAVFVATLALILTRPKGLNEAWFTCGGGILMLLLGLETPRQAVGMVWEGKDALLFLVGLLVLAELMRLSGFFEWAAIHAARSAKGKGGALYRNVFLLGAAVTALLSLDTTAVMLTPVVLAFVGRLGLRPKPFLFACAFVANTGSLLLTVSNLTNLLFAGAFGWNFGAFALRMLLPQLLVLAANYLVFRWLYKKELPSDFADDTLPTPREVVPDAGFFRASVVVFGLVVLGYFAGAALKIPPYAFALAGAAVLLAVGVKGRRVRIGALREISWSVFPFVIGLFVVVRAMENLGLASLVQHGLALGHGSRPLTTAIATFGAGLGSNLVNNIPMALISISSLHGGDDPTRYAALIGCNVGPNLTVTGSLATMLVIATARKGGEDVGAMDFFKVGIVVTPILLLAGTLGILAAFGLK